MECNENWFDSPYYKILYQNRDEQEAQEFLIKLLAYLQPPVGSRILDIACGEGRFAKQLAEHKYDVTGIDISHPAIAKAKAFETENLNFFVQDMRMPFYINYFDYAFNFFTSFGYFLNSRDHNLAAKAFVGCLNSNGILVVDYLNYEAVVSNLVKEEIIHIGSYVFNITRKIDDKHIIKEIKFIDAERKQKYYIESVAKFSLSDFIKMFKIAGLSLVASFGDYELNPYFSSDSARLIMVFKKKNV